jgi:hypothetical protein
MSADDDAISVDNDRLAEAKLPQAGRDGVDGGIIIPGIPVVRADTGNLTNLNVHCKTSIVVKNRTGETNSV